MKKVLITAKAMDSGGVEVSLLNLLNEFKKNQDLDITLLLEKKMGKYLQDIPENIRVEELNYTNKIYSYTLFSKRELNEELKGIELIIAYISKIEKKIFEKLGKNFQDDVLLKKSKEKKEKYDIVIDFHGYGYFMSKYVARKIKARKKVMFIHDEKMGWLQNIKEYMSEFDKFYCVSKSVKKIFDEQFQQYANKSDIFYNIIPKEKILNLSESHLDICYDNEITKILTIGRLEHQKGYDLVIEISKRMKKENEKFIWYIIGKGSQKEEIEKRIVKENLEENVKMLGMKKNPYPYLKMCDIYVQTSRHEGYGIAIAEAKCLNKPIIATNLECIQEQIQNGKTGILCEFDVDEFKTNIQMLMHSEEKRMNLENNLKEEKFRENKDIDKILNL